LEAEVVSLSELAVKAVCEANTEAKKDEKDLQSRALFTRLYEFWEKAHSYNLVYTRRERPTSKSSRSGARTRLELEISVKADFL